MCFPCLSWPMFCGTPPAAAGWRGVPSGALLGDWSGTRVTNDVTSGTIAALEKRRGGQGNKTVRGHSPSRVFRRPFVFRVFPRVCVSVRTTYITFIFF